MDSGGEGRMKEKETNGKGEDERGVEKVQELES
jgi:hypothetical protein